MQPSKKSKEENPRNSKPISLYPLKPADALRRAMSAPPPERKDHKPNKAHKR